MPKEVMQGTLDLMVLRTLETMGPPALLRLEQRKWIKSSWGVSDNNRRAKFYELTARGRREIARETKSWEETVFLMERFLRDPATGEK
jgi:DNA-binding PadR family transcriptional regulator